MDVRVISRFWSSQRANVTIIAALTLPLLLGFVSLAGEFGYGLVSKVQTQRAADLSAYAGALAYSSSNSTSTMSTVAKSVAALNGMDSTRSSYNLASSPRTASNNAIYATVQKIDQLLIAPVLGSGSSLPVASQSAVELGVTAPPCIIALSTSGAGVSLSGGTNVSAPSCAVASNTTVTVPCGTTVSAKAVTYGGSTPSQPCNGISGGLSNSMTADPLASNSAVSTLNAHASALSLLTSPPSPSVAAQIGGLPIEFGYLALTTQLQALLIGCSANLSGTAWTLTCPSGGTYRLSALILDGGLSLQFNTSGSAATTYVFSSAITNGGSSITFGPGTYNVSGGITASGAMTFGAGTYNVNGSVTANGGATLTFGTGTFNISGGIVTNGGSRTAFGAGTFNIGSASCSSGGGNFSICNTGTTLTFGGPSTFALSAGIYNGGGSSLMLGSGSTNSFNIGASSSGYGILTGGGSTTLFADTTGASNIFQVNGNVSAPSGGTCLTLSAAAQHDINGYLSSAGGLILGAGVYSVYNYIAFGANGGGDVSCNGSTVGVTGSNVTLVIGGNGTVSGSSCTSAIFCEGAGFSNINLSAPTSGTNANLVIVGPPSKTNGAFFTEGASSTLLSGALYFPSGPIALSGGASVGNQAGQCLQIIGSQITLAGGTNITSNACFGSSGSSQVQLVQ